jgi:hypothetical protein
LKCSRTIIRDVVEIFQVIDDVLEYEITTMLVNVEAVSGESVGVDSVADLGWESEEGGIALVLKVAMAFVSEMKRA